MHMLNTNPAAHMGWNTPRTRTRGKINGHFLIGMILIILVTGSIAYALVSMQINLKNNQSTMNSQTIPAIATTQQVQKDLETLDIQASDFLAAGDLTGQQGCTLAGLKTTTMVTHQVCDTQEIDAETILLNQDLFAATNNRADADQQTLLERISIGIEGYLTDIHQMRVDYALATQKANLHDPHIQQAYQDYYNASQVLYNQISLPDPAISLHSNQIPFNSTGQSTCIIARESEPLPPDQWMQLGLLQTLDCLNNIDQTNLTETYTNQSSSFTGGTATLLYILFVSVLVFYLFHMVRWTHRLVNLGLLAATLLGISLGYFNWNTLTEIPGNAYQQAIEHDYATISSTDQLQNTVLDARASESRWLLATLFKDKASAITWNEAWQIDATQIAMLQGQVQETNNLPAEAQYLASVNNVWSNYTAIDAQIHTAQSFATAEHLKTEQASTTLDGLENILEQIIQDEQANYNLAQNAIQKPDPLTDLLLFPLTALLAVLGIASNLKHF